MNKAQESAFKWKSCHKILYYFSCHFGYYLCNSKWMPVKLSICKRKKGKLRVESTASWKKIFETNVNLICLKQTFSGHSFSVSVQ